MTNIKPTIDHKILGDVSDKYDNWNLTVALYDPVQDGIAFHINNKNLFLPSMLISSIKEKSHEVSTKSIRQLIAILYFYKYKYPIYLASINGEIKPTIKLKKPIKLNNFLGIEHTICEALPVSYVCHYNYNNTLLIVIQSIAPEYIMCKSFIKSIENHEIMLMYNMYIIDRKLLCETVCLMIGNDPMTKEQFDVIEYISIKGYKYITPLDLYLLSLILTTTAAS